MKIAVIIIAVIVIVVFLLQPSSLNPLTPKGEIVGEFVKGGHRGYGDSCGEYPYTWIKFKNATANNEHFWIDENKVYNDFHFGCQWTDVDNMVVGQKYKVWYHEESRGSDTTPIQSVYYWVIDGYEKLE